MGRPPFTFETPGPTRWTVGFLVLALVCLPAAAEAAGSCEPTAENPAPEAGGSEVPSEVPEVEVVSHTRVVRNPRPAPQPTAAVGAGLRAIVDPASGELTSPPAWCSSRITATA